MSALSKGVFWKMLHIHNSPGDGHCLLHSIKSSLLGGGGGGGGGGDMYVISDMHVKILPMNICGLCEWKLSDDVLCTHVKKFDIILLQETWSADEYYLDDYIFLNFPRKFRHKLSIRNSDGLCVFLKHEFSESVKYTDDILVWVRLAK